MPGASRSSGTRRMESNADLRTCNTGETRPPVTTDLKHLLIARRSVVHNRAIDRSVYQDHGQSCRHRSTSRSLGRGWIARAAAVAVGHPGIHHVDDFFGMAP